MPWWSPTKLKLSRRARSFCHSPTLFNLPHFRSILPTQALASGEAKEELSWLLLEPLADGRYRQWSPSSAVVLCETWRAGQRSIVNPVDPRKRTFTDDTRVLCSVLTDDPKFISGTAAENTRILLRASLKKNLAKAAAGVVGVGIIACSVAAAVCTGVGALGIASSVAKSIISGASNATTSVFLNAGGAGGKQRMPDIPDQDDLDDMALLRARLDRLEHAVFTESPELTQAWGDKVADTWNKIRSKNKTVGR